MKKPEKEIREGETESEEVEYITLHIIFSIFYQLHAYQDFLLLSDCYQKG